jgi:hypothetical protein
MEQIPIDIENYIYEFNPNHRPLYRKCMKKIENSKLKTGIKIRGVHMRMKIISRLFDKQIDDEDNWDLETIVKREIQDPEYVMKCLANCKCCKRHQSYKPTKLGGSLITEVQILNFTYEDHRCRCPCRHNSRFINKAFTNTLNVDDIFSSKWANENLDNDYDDDD